MPLQLLYSINNSGIYIAFSTFFENYSNFYQRSFCYGKQEKSSIDLFFVLISFFTVLGIGSAFAHGGGYGVGAVTPKQVLEYKGEMDRVVMVFILDRIPKSADMTLELSDKQKNTDKGYNLFSKYIIYNGWRVATAIGKFHLLEPDSPTPMFAKIFYRSGGGVSHREMIGLYKLR